MRVIKVIRDIGVISVSRAIRAIRDTGVVSVIGVIRVIGAQQANLALTDIKCNHGFNILPDKTCA